MDPDRPNFKSYCVLDPKLAVGTRPEPFRATFRPPKKSATGKNMNLALEKVITLSRNPLGCEPTV